MNLLQKTLLTMFVSAIAVAASQADEVNPGSVTTFEAGTPALAEEMNANFAALISAINDNAQRTAALEEQIALLDPFSLPPIGNSSYTMVTFDALILASNCNFEQIETDPGDDEADPPVPPTFEQGPNYCSAQSVRNLTLSSTVTVLNFNQDGTGAGSDVFDEGSLRSPDYAGELGHSVEDPAIAQESNFTFSWSQDGNVVTVVDNTPDEAPFEMLVSYDGAVAAIRFAAHGGADDVDDDGAGDRATQYLQAIGIAIRN
jgi:hypothetical protein